MLGGATQLRVVGLAQVDESGAPARVMRARERILPLPVEVIGKNHEATRRSLPRDSSCGARDDQHFDTRETKKAHRKDNFGGRISLVKVQPTGEYSHWDRVPKSQV